MFHFVQLLLFCFKCRIEERHGLGTYQQGVLGGLKHHHQESVYVVVKQAVERELRQNSPHRVHTPTQKCQMGTKPALNNFGEFKQDPYTTQAAHGVSRKLSARRDTFHLYQFDGESGPSREFRLPWHIQSIRISRIGGNQIMRDDIPLYLHYPCRPGGQF